MAIVEFAAHHTQKIKLGVHIVQSVLILVSWILDIVIFRSDASIDGRVGWHFGVCFLTVPAIIYSTMTPRFPRTRKFANPYALVAEDLVFCIIWLSAFAAVANWNGTDKCKNACGVAKGAVALGVLIWLLWILTAFLSIYGCMYYRREGYLPGASRAPHNAAMIDPDKEAFSTAPHDDEYAPVHNVDEHEIHDLDPMQPQYGAGPSSSHLGDEPSYSGGYGGGYVPPTVHDENTSYSGYSGATGTSDVGGRVQFPHARYDNV